MTPENILQNVDWMLLDQQRLVLINLLYNPNLNQEEFLALEGICNLLDTLTDAAHATGRLSRA